MAGARYEYTVASGGKAYGNEGGMYCRVSTGDLGASGNGIGALYGDPVSRWENGISSYFHYVWMIGRTGFDQM